VVAERGGLNAVVEAPDLEVDFAVVERLRDFVGRRRVAGLRANVCLSQRR
jgi:hypothetical protein